jgi:hypothetical protein
MTKQELIENAFKERDISTLRKYKKDQDVDFSFSNNLILRTVADEGLHLNYLKLLNSREECDLFFDNFYCFVNSFKNGNIELFKYFIKNIDLNELMHNKNIPNLFDIAIKTNDYEFIKKVFSWLSYWKETTQEKNDNVLTNYLKNGLIELIKTQPYQQSLHILTDYKINGSLDNHFIVRAILLLDNKENKKKYLSLLSKRATVFNRKNKLIDKEFVDKYAKNTKERSALKIGVNRSLSRITEQMIDNEEKMEHLFLMTEDEDDFYSVGKEYVLRNMIRIHNKGLFNSKIIELLKKYNKFSMDLLHKVIMSENKELFDFMLNYFDLKNNIVNGSYIHILCDSCYYHDNIESKEIREYFIDHILECANFNDFKIELHHLSAIIEESDFMLFNKLHSDNKMDLCHFTYEEVFSFYNLIIDSENDTFFNFSLSKGLGFEKLNKKNINKNINYSDVYTEKLLNSLTIFCF